MSQLNRGDVEKGFVLSLLRWDDERSDAVLSRYAELEYTVDLDSIQNKALRTIFKTLRSYAEKDQAMGVKLAAMVANISEDVIRQGMQKVDRSAANHYARMLLEIETEGKVSGLTREVQAILKRDGSEAALQAMVAGASDINATSDAEYIDDIAEAGSKFVDWYKGYQQRMADGEIRLAFPIPRVNEMLPYIFPGHAVLLTAKSKVGKSSFAGQLFDYNVRRGFNGAYFHWEDSKEVMGIKRTGRQMGLQRDQDGKEIGISVEKMLSCVLNAEEMRLVEYVNEEIATWGGRGTQIHCAGWTVERALAVWRRLHRRGLADFAVFDYLNKANQTSSKLRDWGGKYGAMARDAELIKSAAESLKANAIVIQQENDTGTPFGSKEAYHKMQAWISLVRERLDDGQLDIHGKVCIRAANMGRTGEVDCWFHQDWLVWVPA